METTDELYELICRYPDKTISFYKKQLILSDEELDNIIRKMIRDNKLLQKEGRLYLIPEGEQW